jgi:hypothetical protein
MFSKRKKYEVTDPGHYSQVISDQKKRVCKNKTDPEEWLELGRLFEARVAMTKEFANKRLLIRYSFFIALLFGTGIFFILHFFMQHMFTWEFKITAPLLFTIGLLFLWDLRYPKSGDKYFKKAIKIDPNCGDAYQYLGQIALRKNQKTKAWLFLEKAIQLNAKNCGRIKRDLKSLYEKEFTIFFEEQSQKNIEKQKIIDVQLGTIMTLRKQNAHSQKQIESLNDKVGQIRWETGHQVKMIGKEMEQDISLIHQKYEKQIFVLKQEAENTAKEIAEQKFLRLTTEIMESKSDLEEQSLKAAVQKIKKTVGKQTWQMLSKNVQKYLGTAEQVYTVLKKQKESPDYSLVGMELCKALETKLNQTLITPFVKYIDNNQAEFLRVNQVAEKNKKPLYYTYLANVVDQVSFPEITSLTLGQYHFILSKTLTGDYALQEYAVFLDNIHAQSGIIIDEKFLNNLTIVTKQYRNTITHKSPMDQKQCEHLRQLIFAGNDSLLSQMMRS